MRAKEAHRQKVLRYLANWNNPFPKYDNDLAVVMGIKPVTMRFHFKPAELNDLLDEALELRKKHSATPRAQVYKSMLETAVDGVVPAQKEFLDRTEGKIIQKNEIEVTMIAQLSDTDLDSQISAMLEKKRLADSPSEAIIDVPE